MTFYSAIDRISAEEPSLPAISVARRGAQSDSLTYGRLADASRSVAAGLLAHGVRTRDVHPVATLMTCGPEWYCVYLGASRLGTPLASLSMDLQTDPDAESLRNHTILVKLEPQVVVMSPSESQRWLEVCSYRGEQLRVHPQVLLIHDLLNWNGDKCIDVPVSPEDVLCYAHTGGTTSRQRCVSVAHRMATHEISAYPEALGGGLTAPKVLQPSSLHWAAAVYGQLDLAIAFRGCAVVTNTVDMWELTEVLRQEQIAVAGLPPSLLALLKPSDMDHQSLRCVISWGEACPAAVAERWAAPGLPWAFFDLLISTEYWLGLVGATRNDAGSSVFHCVSGVQILVGRLRDGENDTPVFEEVADGEVGELCIGGLGVCSGFHGAGDQEEAAFMHHQGGRFFRSGDLVIRSGQRLSFAGRGDELVKVSGRWLDLNDVARRLTALPAVSEAAATTTGPAVHAAAVVLSSEADAQEVADSIMKVVPMSLGISVHIVQSIPRNAATQKVDRAGLRAAIAGAPALNYRHLRPAGNTGIERQMEPLESLCAAVAQALALSVDHVHADMSFLALGGDSATAVRAVSLAADRGLRIHALSLLAEDSLRRLVDGPGVSQVCHQQVSGLARLSSASTALASLAGSTTKLLRASGMEWNADRREIARQLCVPACAIDEISSCTPLQEAMLASLDADAQGLAGSAGLLQTCGILGASADIGRFQAAWAAAHHACSTLRTAFARLAGSYCHVVVRDGYVKPAPWSWGQLSLASLEDELQQWLDADAAIGFNLQSPGLYRLALLAVPDGRHVFVLTVHNTVCDAWSCTSLLSQVLAFHIGEASFPVQQPSGKLIAQPYAEKDLDAYAQYWSKVLQGFNAPAIANPTRHALIETGVRPLQTSWDALRRRAAQLRVTPAVLVHAVWAMVWAQFTGRTDVAVGTVLSGREASGERVLGMTLSLLPLRIALRGTHLLVQQLVSAVHRQLLELLRFQHCSFHEVRAWSGLPPQCSLFDSVVIFENAPPLAKEVLQSACYAPLCEREVPMVNSGVRALEFRVSRSSSNQGLEASARGSLHINGNGLELIRSFDSLLALLAAPSAPSDCQDVQSLLQVLPLLPWSRGRSPAELANLCLFWQPVLESACRVESLDIPVDAPRTGTESCERIRMPSLVLWRVTESTRRLAGDISWREAVLAAWSLLLGWQAGQRKLLIGILLEEDVNESAHFAEKALCWFPLLCELKGVCIGSAGFRCFAKSLEERVRAAEAHRSVPRRAVESTLKSPSCEIRAFFASGSRFQSSADVSHAWAKTLEVEHAAELALWMFDGASQGGGALAYDASVLDTSTVELMARRLETSLTMILGRQCPNKSLLEDPAVVLRHERVELMHDLGTGASEPLPEVGIAEIVFEQARRTPFSTAVSAHDATLTYRDLEVAASVVGSRLLQGSGVRVDTVGLLAERSAAMLVGMLATLAIGAAYVPLGPTMPIARLEQMLSIAGVQALASEPRLMQLAASLGRLREISCIVSISDYGGRQQVSRHLSARSFTDLARPMYVLFTSGSTGLPKMVRAASPAALTHLVHVVRSYGYSAFDIGLQHTAPGWVAAMPEIWAPLLVGGRLAVAPGGSGAAARDLEALAMHPARSCSSLLQYVPSVLSAFLRSGFDALGPACRHLVLTGEPLLTDLCQQLVGKGFTLRNHYGQTEVADTTTVYTVQVPLPRAAAVPIGQPAAHRLVWLRNSDGLGGCGEGGGPGEIVAAGPGLFLTSGDCRSAEDNPFGVGCAFGTGDLGRWVQQAGTAVVVCLGRQDRQVKIRGHRIELAEVETILREEGARVVERPLEVAVVVGSDVHNPSNAGLQLHGYVCPLEGESEQVHATILARCAARLPSYMVPTTVTGVGDWPRTSTGKLDRKALPPPRAPMQQQHRSQGSNAPAAVPCCPCSADPSLLRAKFLQIARAILVGALASRFRPWRMALLPYVWFAYAETLSSRGRTMRGFHEELSQRLPHLLFFLGSLALPTRAFVTVASTGAYLAGWQRFLALPVLWWLGLSSVDSLLEGEISWYSWYCTPDGVKSLLQSLVKYLSGSHALSWRLFLGSSQAAKAWSAECGWDQKARWPRRRPGLYHIDIDEEPVHSADAVAATRAPRPIPRREELNPSAKAVLAVLEAEAKRGVSLMEPLASVFDSLRMMGFVVAARQSTGLALSLHDVLKCDVVADLLDLPAVVPATDGDSNPEPRTQRDERAINQNKPGTFRIAEWPYMFRLSICWALASDHIIDEDALREALRDLCRRHETLRTEIADPPMLLELAMEAAGNLALLRSMVNQGDERGNGLFACLCCKLSRAVAAALHCAWPRVVLRAADAVPAPLDVVNCADHEQAEHRSAWLLDGRNGRRFLRSPLHAVLLRTPSLEADGSVDLLHIAVSHGLCDGFSGLPLLRDLQIFYARRKRKRAIMEEQASVAECADHVAKRPHVGTLEESPDKEAPSQQARKRKADEALLMQDVPNSLGIQERRLRCALLGEDEKDASDLASPALSTTGHEAYDHFVRLAPASLQTLARVSDQRRWCCSLDVALLSVLACALARLRGVNAKEDGKLSLRFAVAVRDGPDEGQLVADLSDYRDLDLAFTPGIGVEAAARAVAMCIRHRQWSLPAATTDGSERIFLNFRPLLQDLGVEVPRGEALWHQSQWPPVYGEWNWESRNIHQSMWIMADQVGQHEWVLYLKVQWARPGDAFLGGVLKNTLRDIALSPDTALLPEIGSSDSNTV